MINIPDILKNASLGNLSSSARGIKMTVYYSVTYSMKKKKRSVIWTSIERSNPSGPLRLELLQMDTLSPVYLCLPEQLMGRY